MSPPSLASPEKRFAGQVDDNDSQHDANNREAGWGPLRLVGKASRQSIIQVAFRIDQPATRQKSKAVRNR